MSPLDAHVVADFLLYFLRHNGVAIMVAAPAICALVFWPVMRPRKHGEKS